MNKEELRQQFKNQTGHTGFINKGEALHEGEYAYVGEYVEWLEAKLLNQVSGEEIVNLKKVAYFMGASTLQKGYHSDKWYDDTEQRFNSTEELIKEALKEQ